MFNHHFPHRSYLHLRSHQSTWNDFLSTMTKRSPLDSHDDVFEDEIEDYTTRRISLCNIDIQMVFHHYESIDDSSDWFASKIHEYRLDIEMAMYHCEHVNDNEDHLEWQNSSRIDYICEVYPTIIRERH